MLAATRPAAIDDAILGVTPRVVYSPASVIECAEVIAATDRDKQRIAFVGAGTSLDLGAPPAALDAVVRTAAMARIVEYAPADMVMVVEAGTTLAQVQAAAGRERQTLALDPPDAERATIGGLVATGAYGPRRARYGAIRDLIIGVTLIRADGVVAHGGGKVVKNVAGFDLPKMACGSLGTLGMIAGATFRLHPLPEMNTTVLFERVAVADLFALVKAVRQAQLEPSSAVAIRTNSGAYDLGFRFEGFGKGVTQQIERILALGRTAGTACAALNDSETAAFWKRHEDVRSSGSLRVKLVTMPSRFANVDSTIAPLLGALSRPSFAWYATLGIGFVAGETSDAAAATAALRAAREAVVLTGGSLVIEAAPAAVRAGIDVWGPVSSSFRVMEELKQRFDPERRLNPGRFVGGL